MKKFVITEICNKFYSDFMACDIVEFKHRPLNGSKITGGRIECNNEILKDQINVGTVYSYSYTDGYKIIK
jgi:hypothetical protein